MLTINFTYWNINGSKFATVELMNAKYVCAEPLTFYDVDQWQAIKNDLKLIYNYVLVGGEY